MPDDNLIKLGRCIRGARKNRRLTQQDLSDISGVSVRHIAKIEKGTINPSFDKLSALVTALRISFDALFWPCADHEETDIMEFTGLYRGCSRAEQELLMETVRTLTLGLANISEISNEHE